ncbi:FAD-dependent oxidoreductase [Pseudoalteromonas sp. SSM20]|uniref:FAD-dependent oxidoreductase n=1 Tax=Pseudoalteromonas sp. SSM20 TaxID=3139394 RepID=UPI003BAABC86
MSLSICIIGGGMVGAAAAVALAKQGHTIKLIENNPIEAANVLSSEHIDIRVSALNLFSENLLSELGAWQHIAQSRSAEYKRLSVQDYQKSPLIFNNAEIGESHLGHIIENSVIQASIWQEFSHHTITVLSGLGKLEGILHSSDKTSLCYESQTLEADLVIVADGARSHTRELLGIGTTGWQYQQACMGVLIKLDAEQQDITWQEFQATGPVAFLPMQAPYANLIWYNHEDTLRKLADGTKSNLKDAILANYPSLPGDFEIIKTAVFPLTRQHANQYSKGNCVLVGDAAHAINPLAGQGVNLGFKDVAQLVKSLSKETCLTKVLKDYEQKRRIPNLAMMSMMDACYFAFSNELTPLKLLRQSAIAGLSKLSPVKSQMLKYAVGHYL